MQGFRLPAVTIRDQIVYEQDRNYSMLPVMYSHVVVDNEICLMKQEYK